MRALLVVVAACSAPAAAPQAPRVVEPTGPELVTSAPGAMSFAIDGSDIYWLAPGSGVWELAGGSATKLAEVGSDAHELAVGSAAVYWAHDDVVMRVAKGGGAADQETDTHSRSGLEDSMEVMPPVRTIAVRGSQVDVIEGYGPDGMAWSRWIGHPDGSKTHKLRGEDPVIAIGSDTVIGTSTELEQHELGAEGGWLRTPVDGGVRALAVDGDDIFFGNTSIFEKYGQGPVNKLGPAGGPVTAMAVDPSYIYWAIGAGDRDPAIYRAKRAKPELELFTRVGSASQLVVAGEFLYWLDPAEGAIHRIKRQK